VLDDPEASRAMKIDIPKGFEVLEAPEVDSASDSSKSSIGSDKKAKTKSKKVNKIFPEQLTKRAGGMKCISAGLKFVHDFHVKKGAHIVDPSGYLATLPSFGNWKRMKDYRNTIVRPTDLFAMAPQFFKSRYHTQVGMAFGQDLQSSHGGHYRWCI